MAINHDLSYYPDYLVSTDNLYDHVVFLDLGNRLETFDKDAEFLEKEYQVAISRIHPRECLEATVPACRIPIKEGLELIRKLIANGHKVAVSERLLTPLAPDVGYAPAQQELFTLEAEPAEGKLPALTPRR